MKLFNEMLGGENITIQAITAFYNPILTSSFLNAWNLNNTRFIGAPNLFNAKTVKTFETERAFILSEYDEKVHYYAWNSSLHVPIVPCMNLLFVSQTRISSISYLLGLHGTDQCVGEKIAETGFVALSSTDSGYFGKGIYCMVRILTYQPRLTNSFSYFLCQLHHSLYPEQEKSCDYHFVDLCWQCLSCSRKSRWREFFGWKGPRQGLHFALCGDE
jgi:hypothetical protein